MCDCHYIVNFENGSGHGEHYNTCMIKLKERQLNGEFPQGLPRNEDGTLRSQNKHLEKIPGDFLYHLNLGVATHDLQAMFGDIKFVCMGGTATRMQSLAKFAQKELGCILPVGSDLIDLTASSNRYSMYKIGPILTINHGIGISTLSVVLQEVIKMMRYSKATDPIFIRVGTSGGIGIEPGTVVVSDKGYDGMLNDTYDVPILGNMVKMPAILDKRLALEMCAGSLPDDEFKIVHGHTICANCFYNGQGRIDGPFCDYSENDKLDFLKKLSKMGIRNFEMEVTCFAALTYKAGLKAADVCVTLLDRLKGDQVTIPKDLKVGWEERPMVVVMRLIKRYLENQGRLPYGKC